MQLYLLRHAMAAERDAQQWPDDSQRPLTDEGRVKMRKVARGMGALDLSFDMILTSPYARAQETAEIVARRFAGTPLMASEQLTPDGSFDGLVTFLRELSEMPRSVLLVGHEPHLGEVACQLLSGEPGAFIVMKKGGLACLHVEHLDGRHPRARLEWLLTPKLLRALA